MTLRATSIGAINIDLLLNDKKFQKGIVNIANTGSKQLERSFGNTFKKIGIMAAAAFSVKAITDFMSSCLQLGSDLTEVQNVVDTAFPTMSAQADEFARNAADSFGLSETMAKRYMGTFGAMANSFGFAEKEALEMSETLTGLAGDVASFYNITQDEAYTRLSAVFTGETEALKELGVVMTQAALDQYALANGFGKTTANMTEQEKVALRYAFVQQQLSLATGDFIKTQDSWANQTRILALRFDSLKASIGRGFIAVFTPVIKGINWVLANLQSLADSFANMMEFLTGGSGTSGSSGGGNSEIKEVSNDLSDATGSAGGLSDGLKNAGSSGEKAAKKIQRAFAKVDTINKLSFGSESDSGSGGSDGSGAGAGGGGSVAEAVDFPEASKQASVFDGVLSGLINEFKRLAGIFASGFEIGFGDSFSDLKRIKDYITSIGESLISIFTDPGVVNAAKNWVESTIFALGQITGSIASVGVTIATLLVGSVATYLERNTDFITNKIVKWFDLDSKQNLIIGAFSTVIADIASVFASPTAVNIGANLIEIIANGAIGSLVLIKQLGVDIIDTLTAPIINNRDLIKTTLEEMLKPIETITRTIADGINNTLSTISSVYDEYIGPAFEKIKTGLTDIVIVLLEAYNTYIAPIVNGIAQSFSIMWQEHVQPAIDSVVVFIGKFVELVGVVFEQFLVPLVEWLINTLAPTIASVINGAWTIIEGFITFVSDCISSVMEILSGIVDFLTGVFTGNWSKAWDGIKSILSGAWDLMCTIVSAAVDVVKGIIDTALEFIVNLWESIWGFISSFLSNAWNGICSIIDTSINIVTGIISNALNGIKAIWESVWGGIKTFVGNVWNGIKSIFNGIITFVKGTFTSAWKGAWEGVKNVFSNIVNGLANIFKSPINFIIDGINKFIGGLNKIKIPDWVPIVGGKGFNISKIPKLAQGGYVKANQPQLAMIGDNKRYGEIVAPENKMLDMINTALKMQKETGNAEGMDTLIELIRELIELVKNMVIKVDIDIKKLSILLENAKKERQMIGG